MSEFRLSPEAEAELDGIWIRIAQERQHRYRHPSRRASPSDFGSWRGFPYLGRQRDEDLAPGLRSFPADDYVIIHRIKENDVILILHVVHGSRDIAALFGY
jgi:plasmid stabilization system protein ParE